MIINNGQVFKRPNIFKIIYGRLYVAYRHLRHPENVWYGGGLKRETAIRSVGAGWKPFIEKLYDAMPKRTKVLQVKEKFAGLRFYISSAPEWYHDLISHYENQSYKICEVCGEKGKVREDLGWILTLCNNHYKERKAEIVGRVMKR